MKKYISIFLTLICAFGLVGCSNKSMNYIIKNKPSVTGTVEEVYDDYIIVYSEKADGYPNGSNWSISLNVENKDSYIDVIVGDEIVFYYDGMAMETDPLQVSKVYAITLKTPADRTKEELSDLIPMVMVNGELYLDTGHEASSERKCGTMDGEILSAVDGTEKPTKDNQSNFGTGYGYQYGSQEGTIEIYMNNKWWIFATEEVRQQIQFPTSEETISFHDKPFNKSDLSEETIEWLEKYNSLSAEEQLAISYIPSELYELCGYPTVEDMVAEETIIYNGKEYKKSELCDATLHWLELSEQERMLSSYLPPEFMIFEETWGVTLIAENITSTSATIKCTQSGGDPTGELHTGSWYILENWTQENGWTEMPYIIDGEIGWTQEAWIIPMNNTCEWEINWEWLYGTVPKGKYRIGKEVADFRATGDYDKAIYFAEFEIME